MGDYKVKKHTFKGKRSCTNCQQSKSRCDIDRETIRPGSQSQPSHLACHRCRVLQLSCTFHIPSDEGGTTDRKVNRTNQFKVKNYSQKTDSTSTESVQLNLQDEDKIHVFDPRFETDGFGEIKRNGYLTNHNDESANGKQPWQSLEIQDRLHSLRPFSYLHRLCSLQPDFLTFPAAIDKSKSISLGVILDRHSNSIDWKVMEEHLQKYHFFLPFLGSFQSHPESQGSEQVYLATVLYLAALQTDLIELIADLHILLRQEVISCILRGPTSIGEASALLALSIYEPLVAARSIQEMQLDGSGLLAAASTALRMLNLERIPNIMHQYTLDSHHNPSTLLTQCSLWITAAFISGFNVLAGNVMQRPLLQCTLRDIDQIESYCQYLSQSSLSLSSSASASSSAPWKNQLLFLKLLLFRHRSVIHFHDIIKTHLLMLKDIPISSFGPAEALLVQGISKSSSFAKESLHNLQSLRPTLSLPSHTCHMLMDYMEFETEQLHMFCIIHFTEACLLRIANHYGRPIDLFTLANRITRDESATHFANAVINVNKRDMSRRLTTIYANFISRWCRPTQQRQQRKDYTFSNKQIHIPLALPPVYINAMMLTNVKTLADFIGGYAHLGINPRDCLDDCDAGLTICLCRNHADALQTFANHTKDLYQAKGHRDYYQMTADIALRTANAIHEWAATKKGLRNQQTNNKNVESGSDLAHHQSALNSTKPIPDMAADSDTMQIITETQGQDFDHLLEQILSTPISFS